MARREIEQLRRVAKELEEALELLLADITLPHEHWAIGSAVSVARDALAKFKELKL